MGLSGEFDAVGIAILEPLIVRDNDQGRSHCRCLFFEQANDGRCAGVIQCTGGFICQHNGGTVDEGTCNARSLLFPDAQVARSLVGFVGDAQLFKHGHPRVFVERHALQKGRNGEVFKNGKALNEMRLLEDDAHVLTSVAIPSSFRQAAEVLSIE